MWQDMLVFLLVATAAAYVLKRAWRALALKRSNCAGCPGGCGKGEFAAPVVELESLVANARDMKRRNR
ncbi:MAG: FeoB-associated Cys-rich membrane protein [Pirellulaceae bacterium]